MQAQGTNRFNVSILVFAVLFAAVAVLSGVMATRAIDEDGRLNLVAHLGGDALYCVDENMNPSNNYAGGGLRLLSRTGQELLFVPAETIDAFSPPLDENTIIADGYGSYGPVWLWRLTDGDFVLVGQDEHHKEYQFAWSGCTPVGPISEEPVTEEPIVEPTAVSTEVPV